MDTKPEGIAGKREVEKAGVRFSKVKSGVAGDIVIILRHKPRSKLNMLGV